MADIVSSNVPLLYDFTSRNANLSWDETRFYCLFNTFYILQIDAFVSLLDSFKACDFRPASY